MLCNVSAADLRSQGLCLDTLDVPNKCVNMCVARKNQCMRSLAISTHWHTHAILHPPPVAVVARAFASFGRPDIYATLKQRVVTQDLILILHTLADCSAPVA